MEYYEFLESKIKKAEYYGFDVDPSAIHPSQFPHQRDISIWALKGGRRAIFASFGLGKTRIQCELLRQIHRRHGYGIELSEEYYRDGVNYCKAAEYQLTVPTLFDDLEPETKSKAS